jgi:uncharacterized repeat protein (TIGR03803 family)
LLLWLRRRLQNHARRHADGTARLRPDGRLRALCGSNPGQRWELLRDDAVWWRQRRWRSLQNDPNWDSDEGLYSFCPQSDCTDGYEAYAGVIQGTDGNFYGETGAGGANSAGTVFSITPSGVLTTLHSFDVTDGEEPFGGLVQATDGEFFGTADGGGINCPPFGCGTVFSLSVGLKPFVETLPTSGAVGTAVTILGSNLTGATGVRFNGIPAVFTVVSKSLITAAVPAGATTGTVQVVTPNGNGLSNVPFTVLP